MRAAALVLLAIIGFVNSQQIGGINHQDQGRAYGGWSQGRKDFGGNNPLGGNPMNGGFGAGGFGVQQQYPSLQQQPGNNGLNQQNVGNAPLAGGSSGGQYADFGPQVVNTGPASNNVNHVNAGAQPQNTGGGNSGLQEIPLGPVQTGMTDQVNMQNAGAPPEQGQGNQNSGEYVYDWGAPVVGGAAANGATGDMAPAAPLGGEAVLGQGTGGNSGNGGNAYNGGQYSDNAGQNAPLGGAQISDFTQREAGKPAHSTGAASYAGPAVGVVIAVLVLVGIVGVAAVFLIKQRRSRMGLTQV